MFIGHYGVALAAKRVTPQTPLGVLFVAVQLMDVVFGLLVLAGIEKLRIVPGFTGATPYDLYFMPYSHSLAGAVFWSALGALVFGLGVKGAGGKKGRVLAALVFGGAVLSHFALDYPMHTPDLPLGFDASSPKVGLGLWNQIDVTVTLEVGMLVAGGALYAGVTLPRAGKQAATSVTTIILLALAVATPFVPPPGSPLSFALQALGAYAALALLAEWMDRSRQLVV